MRSFSLLLATAILPKDLLLWNGTNTEDRFLDREESSKRIHDQSIDKLSKKRRVSVKRCWQGWCGCSPGRLSSAIDKLIKL